MKTILWGVSLAGILWVGAWLRGTIVSPLLTAFHATAATPKGFSLNGWVELSPEAGSTGSLKSLAVNLAQEMHVTGPVVTNRGPTYQRISIGQTVAKFYTDVIAERLQNGSTFLVVDRTGNQGFSGLRESTQMLRHTLSRKGGAVHLDVTLEGALKGHLTPGQAEAVVKRSFGAVGAKSVNGIATAQYVSVAGDSRLIQPADNLQGHPVNIQVALNYNTYWHQEQIDMGSPLITVTY